MTLKAGADQSEIWSAFEAEVAPGFDVGAHLHQQAEEVFYVLEGEIVFELDGTRHTVREGGTVYLRRGVVHAYQNFTNANARLLIATTPGAFCRLFVEVSAATPPGEFPAIAVLTQISEKYGITVVGPPMTE